MTGNNQNSLNDQAKYWSVEYFVGNCKEGAVVVFQELSKLLVRKCKQYSSHLRFQDRAINETNHDHRQDHHSEHQHGSNNIELQNFKSSNEPVCKLEISNEQLQHTTTIVYGFHIISSLFNFSLLWIPGFVFDVRPGLFVSRRFVVVQYWVCLLGLLVGLVLVNIVVESTIEQILPGLIRSVYKLIHFLVVSSEFSYITFGMCSCAWVIYYRDFINEFILYQCSIITLPKQYQRKQAVYIYSSAVLFAFTSEPLFALLALAQDIDQAKFMVESTRVRYLLAKLLLIVIITLASMLISMLSMIFPTVTRFLIVVITKHLEASFEKQLFRSHKIDQGTSQSLANGELNSLLDKQVLNIINDYSCDTLAKDWPQLDSGTDDDDDDYDDDRENELDQTARAMSDEFKDGGYLHEQFDQLISLATSTPTRIPNKLDYFSPQDQKQLAARPQSINLMQKQQQLNSRSSSTTGSLLFLYKNLVKSLSELKGLIESYEQKFGSFHLFFVCISGLIVSQLIVAGLTQARLMRTRNVEASNAGNTNGTYYQLDDEDQEETTWGQVLTPFAFRTGVGVFAFAISNTIFFLQCDCLPNRMNKMRSQLFKMNINLGLTLIDREQRRQHQQQSRDFNHNQKSRINSSGQSRQLSSDHNNKLLLVHNPSSGSRKFDWSELDQVWSLYDQVERMSKRANFKFTADTYYNKNCLLLIFGRVISLVLLYVQVIDIYSYV